MTFAALMVGGGADTLSLDEYFEQSEAIDADVDSHIEAAYAEYLEDVSEKEVFTDDTNLPFFKDLIAAFPPPSEVADAYDK